AFQRSDSSREVLARRPLELGSDARDAVNLAAFEERSEDAPPADREEPPVDLGVLPPDLVFEEIELAGRGPEDGEIEIDHQGRVAAEGFVLLGGFDVGGDSRHFVLVDPELEEVLSGELRAPGLVAGPTGAMDGVVKPEQIGRASCRERG